MIDQWLRYANEEKELLESWKTACKSSRAPGCREVIRDLQELYSKNLEWMMEAHGTSLTEAGEEYKRSSRDAIARYCDANKDLCRYSKWKLALLGRVLNNRAPPSPSPTPTK